MQELSPRITMKFVVKGDQTATACRSEGDKVRVGPAHATQVERCAPMRQQLLKSREFRKQTDSWTLRLSSKIGPHRPLSVLIGGMFHTKFPATDPQLLHMIVQPTQNRIVPKLAVLGF